MNDEDDSESRADQRIGALQDRTDRSGHKAVPVEIARSVDVGAAQRDRRGRAMPIYHRLGEVPRKRHTIFRQPSGELYSEHLMGSLGFSGPASLLYHIHKPTSVVQTRVVTQVKLEPDAFHRFLEEPAQCMPTMACSQAPPHLVAESPSLPAAGGIARRR